MELESRWGPRDWPRRRQGEQRTANDRGGASAGNGEQVDASVLPVPRIHPRGMGTPARRYAETLVERDLEQLSGLMHDLSMEEVEQIYLPLSRLLNLQVAAAQERMR